MMSTATEASSPGGVSDRILIESMFPHRARLREFLVANRDSARSQIPGADPYSVKKLEQYASDMDKQIEVVDNLREDYDDET